MNEAVSNLVNSGPILGLEHGKLEGFSTVGTERLHFIVFLRYVPAPTTPNSVLPIPETGYSTFFIQNVLWCRASYSDSL